MRHSCSEATARPNVLTLMDALQAVCSHYNVYTFEELGLGCAPLEIPVLRTIHFQNQRLWNFVTCFVASRRINTLYECICGFLEHAGVQTFAELGIGNSFIHAEAIQMHYQAPTSLPQVTTKEILEQLKAFQSQLANDPTRNSHHIDRNEFMVFLAQIYGTRNTQELGLYIDPGGFGTYISFLRRLGNQEAKQLKLLEQDFRKCLAEQMFELTKEKFSASNRQKALDELLAASASASSTSDSGSSGRRRQRPRSDLGSLSVEILNRVTQVDVFMDAMLQQKAELLPANASDGIAEMDSKIRNKLTPLLVASQKSRHHSRIKVVTWVLCGILAKIQTLLVADPQDKAPEVQPPECQKPDTKSNTDEEDEDDEDDDEEECDCCCVGKEVCKCDCKCECHVASDNEQEEDEEGKGSGDKKKTSESTKQSGEGLSTGTEPRQERSLEVDQQDMFAQAQTVVKSFVDSQSQQMANPEGPLAVLETLDYELQRQVTGWRESSLLRVLKSMDSSCQRRLARSYGQCRVSKRQLMSFLTQYLSFGSKSDSSHKSVDTKELLLKIGLQFGVQVTDQAELEVLGYGTLDELVASCQDAVSGVAELTVIYSSALRGEEADRVDDDVRYLEEEAVKMLCSVPYLLDIEEAVQWRQKFQPFLGDLEGFIERKRLRGECKQGFMVLNCHDILYRINENSTPSDLAFGTKQNDDSFSGREIAIHLVSILVKSGNMAQFPRQLVLIYLKKTVDRALLRDESSTTSIWRLLVDALMAIPSELGCFLSPVLVEAVAGSGCAASEADCMWKLWTECHSTAEQIKLAYLGTWCNLELWKQKLVFFMEHGTFESERQNQIKLSNHISHLTDNRKPDQHAANDAGSQVEPVSAVDNSQRNAEMSVDDPVMTNGLPDAESCQAFIEKLRQEQFGIGLELDATTSQVLDRQRKRLERVMKRLSDELYSENTHFVYELLQNADDNEYAAHVTPRGEFVFSNDRIVFHSNESGFSAQNIQAICDVGASTKEAAGDMIGHKGIGFKSVFKVSNSPEVHSNGYHIRFFVDRDGNPLGYILPYWIEDPQEWIQKAGSSFVLPLNQASPQEISGSLDELEPSLLLFLKQIQEIHINDTVRNKHILLRKRIACKENHSIVSIEKNGVVQKWFVAKERLPVDAEWAVQCGRKSVDLFTEISLAFPLADEKSDISNSDLRGNPQKVFAFLPLRSYGFRFIVQADFDVPSSREAIFEGSQWNQWLISQFPALFCKAFVEYQRAQLPLEVFFDLFPREREIQFPFRSFSVESTIQFRDLCCLRTEAAETAFDSPLLVRPREVLDVVDLEDLLEDLMAVGQDLFVAALGKRFLSVQLSKKMAPGLKSQLRIEKLESVHLLRLGTKFQEFQAAFPDQMTCEWVVRWLFVLSQVCLLEKHVNKVLLFEELATMPVFPLQQYSSTTESSASRTTSKHWVSFRSITSTSADRSSATTTHQTLFLPHSSGGDTSHFLPQVLRQLAVLDEEFVAEMEKQPQVKAFLKQLGLVKSMKEHDLLFHHVLPLYTSAEGSRCATEDRAMYLSFVAGHWNKCNCLEKPEHAALRSALRLACVQQSSTDVVVVYDSQRELLEHTLQWLKDKSQELREEEDDTVRSLGDFELAVVKCQKPEEEAIVRAFVDRLLKLKSFTDFTAEEEKNADRTIWPVLLKALADETQQDRKRQVSREISKFLDVWWPQELSSKSSTTNGLPLSPELQDSLTNAKWIEASDSRFYAASQLCRQSSSSSAAAASGHETKGKAEDPLVPVALFEFHNTALIASLGLRSHPTINQVLSQLHRLSVDSDRDYDNVKSSLQVAKLTQVYDFLSVKAEANEKDRELIAAKFAQNRLVFVPSKATFSGATPPLCWSSKSLTNIQDKRLLNSCLDTWYPKRLSGFFIRVCGISRVPDVNWVCQRLEKKKSIQWTGEWVAPLFKCWAKRLRKNQLTEDQVARIKRLLWSRIDDCVVAKWSCTSCDVAFAASCEDLLLQELVEAVATTKAEEEEEEEGQETTPVPVRCVDCSLFGSKTKWVVPLLEALGLQPLRDHITSNAIAWCEFLNQLCCNPPDNSFDRKRELVFRVLSHWVADVDNGDDPTKDQKQRSRLVWELHNATFFPSTHRFCSSSEVFLLTNETLTLSKQQLEQSGVLLLDFGDTMEVDESLSRFLVAHCGLQRVERGLTVQVVQHEPFVQGSRVLCDAICQSLSLAQRFLVTQYAKIYKKRFKRTSRLHKKLVELAQRLTCRVCESSELLHVVYSMGKSHSWQHQCVVFLDLDNCVLYLGCNVGVASTSSDGQLMSQQLHFSFFYEIVMELSQKCFGSDVASSVANFLYLASLQPTDQLETWLQQGQHLAPLDDEKVALWVADVSQRSCTACSEAPSPLHKRQFAELQAADIGVDGRDMKRQCVQPGAISLASVPYTGVVAPPPVPTPTYRGYGNPCVPVPMRPLAPFASGALANSLSQEEKTAIGRWGEEFVFHRLQQEFEQQKQHQQEDKEEQHVEVEWVNQHHESGEPYDIKLTRQRGKQRVTQFIEVKSTKTSEKALFEISMNELEYAGIHGANYSIFRVFNAGNAELCRIERFNNPIALVRLRKIQLAVVAN